MICPPELPEIELTWMIPDDTETIGILNPGTLLHGFVAAVEVTVGVPLICTRPEEADRTVTVPLICISPEETLTIGILNPGADDHGFVPAVAVTVGVPLIWRNPEEALTIGTLNPGALDHGLVPAVAVTVGTEESVTTPDDSARVR